ncbi:MAG: DUF1223 domain-containing protein [Amphiplicatus sp.]
MVVEMFLSQSCKTSPPAAVLASELQNRSDLVILNWHIDYWNILSNRKHGRWIDPFAKPEFSERQRAYNRKIRNRGSVFTPQAIIDGEESVVASKRDKLETGIAAHARNAPARIDVVKRGRNLSITITNSADAEAFLVRFHNFKETTIKAGDNAGLVFREPNVVAAMTRLGAVSDRASFSAPAPEADMGCAILVQKREQGEILGARYCP